MFFSQDKKEKRDWAVGLDFGMSQVRGVLIRRKDAALKLEAFDVRPLKAVVGQVDAIPAAVATVAQLFNGWTTVERCAFVAINPPGAIISQAELPPMPLTEASPTTKGLPSLLTINIFCRAETLVLFIVKVIKMNSTALVG